MSFIATIGRRAYSGYDGLFLSRQERLRGHQNGMTIHNIEFQGRMDQSCITDVFGIPETIET